MQKTEKSPNVSLSIRTKLLISVVATFFCIIAFLSVSTVYLLKGDKLAYVYRAQATEASLEARGFVDQVRPAIETLRTFLGAEERSNQRSIILNQTNVLAAWRLQATSTGVTVANGEMGAPILNDKQLQQHQIGPELMKFSPEAAQRISKDLAENFYAFLNLTENGGEPLLAIFTSGGAVAGNRAAVGIISLRELGREATGQSLTIATKSGWVLFDKDPALNSFQQSVLQDPLFQFAAASTVKTGAREFSAKNEHYLGTFVLPGLDLIVLSKTDWDKAMTATYTLLEKLILLGFMAIGIAVAFSIVFAKSLTAPLLSLYSATKEVARGNFKVVLSAKTKRDEIGVLTDSFGVMSRKIEGLIAESVEKVKLENEVKIAATVQETLIPPRIFQNNSVRICSHYQSASQCGGDWWGFFETEGKLFVMIGDATGHGLPSALITASARSCFSVLKKFSELDPMMTMSPAIMLSFANRAVFEAAHGKINMTFFVGVIDFEKKTMTYANGGHNHPWRFRPGETMNKSLTGIGPRLGESPDLAMNEVEERVIDIASNDTLILYTDGLTEGTDLQGKMYGRNRARKVISSNIAQTPEHIVDVLAADFLLHNSGKPLDDDFTVAAIRLL